MTTDDDQYPLVTCPEHGVQRSYVVCAHVIEGEREPVEFLLPSPTEIGEILCDLSHNEYSDFKVLCEEHCRRWLK